MKDFINTHFKLLFFWISLAIVAIAFFKVFTIVFFALSIVVVVEPVYIRLLKLVQRRHYSTGLWSQVILILFLLAITAFACVIFVLPLYYLQKNFSLIIQLAGNFTVLLENNAHRFFVPVASIHSYIQASVNYIISFSADTLKALPEHFTNLLIFYITLFAGIKYFRHGKRDLLSIMPVNWLKVLRHLYARIYQVLRAFYVVHVLIAILVFFLSFVLYKALGITDLVFFSLITSILQLIPFVGAASMMIGMTIYYAIAAEYVNLLFVVLLGFPMLVILPEMVVRPWMMGRNARISMTVIMLGVLAGIKSMGIIGLVFGPVLLVLCQEMFIIVKEKYGEKIQH